MGILKPIGHAYPPFCYYSVGRAINLPICSFNTYILNAHFAPGADLEIAGIARNGAESLSLELLSNGGKQFLTDVFV